MISNIEKNLFEHVASFYGTSPYYDYFLSLPRQLGWLLLALIFGVAGGALGFRQARFRERDALILVPAILYVLVHSAIAHKEIRFMFPIVPVFFYLLAWALSSLGIQLEDQGNFGGSASDGRGDRVVRIRLLQRSYLHV